jgi:hypothetical protein
MITLILLVLSLMLMTDSYIETFTVTNQEVIQRVNSYPTNFSIDPLYSSTFKPECCTNNYSNSHGCLCLDPDILSLLYSRGGNNYDFRYAT